MRVMGLPVQFLAVVAVSLLITIYLIAATADSRIEARAITSPAGGSAGAAGWEQAALIVCPLH